MEYTDMKTMRFTILSLACCLFSVVVSAAGVGSFARTVSANGKSFAVQGVKVNLRDPGVSIKTGLAYGCVGRTEALAGIAQRYHAVAAINGSFFDAYTKDALKNPDMSLISGGHLVFKSNIGSLLGFDADNTPHIGRVRYTLTGTIERENGHPLSWYTYYINRKPTATPCVTLFNSAWGTTVQPMNGTSVVVERGVVISIRRGSVVNIPKNGYVIHVRGEQSLLARFKVGETLTFDPEMTVADGNVGEWGDVQEAVGAGPRVLDSGVPIFKPQAEGFSDQKVLSLAGARSAAGFTNDGYLYLITVRSARVADLGHILKALGCTEGINLDGGASSGLWFNGKYLTTPGRQISNALLVLEK